MNLFDRQTLFDGQGRVEGGGASNANGFTDSRIRLTSVRAVIFLVKPPSGHSTQDVLVDNGLVGARAVDKVLHAEDALVVVVRRVKCDLQTGGKGALDRLW